MIQDLQQKLFAARQLVVLRSAEKNKGTHRWNIRMDQAMARVGRLERLIAKES